MAGRSGRQLGPTNSLSPFRGGFAHTEDTWMTRSQPSRAGEMSVAPVKMVMNRDLIWEQESSGVEAQANPHQCSADTTEPGELPQGRETWEL